MFRTPGALCLLPLVLLAAAAAGPPGEKIEPSYVGQEWVMLALQSLEIAPEGKVSLNADISHARARFFAAKGIRGGKAESEFAEVLYIKDVYYLSMFLKVHPSSTSANRMELLDSVPGSVLDGGILPQSSYRFDEWVDAVRAELLKTPAGKSSAPTPAQLSKAVSDTAAAYELYRGVRDKEEFQIWRATNRMRVPPATTPEECADHYVMYVLDKKVRQALLSVPSTDRPAMTEKMRIWMNQLRQAIVDYERSTPTVESVVDRMRSDNYPDAVIEFFTAKTSADIAREGPSKMEDILAHWYDESIMMNDTLRGVRPPSPGSHGASEDVIRNEMHQWVFAKGLGQLTPEQRALFPPEYRLPALLDYLYGPGQPMKFTRDTYPRVRRDIIAGRLRSD
jgi:hypothetical protein